MLLVGRRMSDKYIPVDQATYGQLQLLKAQLTERLGLTEMTWVQFLRRRLGLDREPAIKTKAE